MNEQRTPHTWQRIAVTAITTFAMTIGAAVIAETGIAGADDGHITTSTATNASPFIVNDSRGPLAKRKKATLPKENEPITVGMTP